jgi:hypothetical protein
VDHETRLQAWLSRKIDAVQAFNDSSGDFNKARKVLRAKYRAAGLDPLTIMLLIQIALQVWKWARDNGYLSRIEKDVVPTMPSFGDQDYQFATEMPDDA